MALADIIPGYNPDPFKEFVAGLQKVRGDGDAIALLPYDDGTLYPKRAYFDKNLVGGIGGYETDDGDKIAVDGDGEAVRDLFGVPVLLAVDPTEHAAAVDLVKALIAHKNNIGEWLRVDAKGNVVQVGPALEPAASIATAEDVETAMANATDDELLSMAFADYNAEQVEEQARQAYIERVDADAETVSEEELAEAVASQKTNLVAEHEDTIRAAIATVLEQPPNVSEEGVVGDGGMVTEYMNQHPENISFDAAMRELAEQGKLDKIYDIAPPSKPIQRADGTIDVESATHIAVDQSKAADLLPTTWDTVELNTALDKARMEEYDEGRLMKYFTYGIIAGGVGGLIFMTVMFVLFSIGGGVF